MKNFFRQLKIQFALMLENLTPEMISSAIKSGLAMVGLKLTGFWGWIVVIFLKYFSKLADKKLDETSDKIKDQINHEEYKEVINNENATLEEKINSETDLLNGN